MDLFEILTSTIFTADQVWLVVKLAYLVGLLMYLVFAFVVVRQVELMSRTFNGTVELPIKLVAKIHLVVAVIVLVIVLVVL